MTDDKSDPGSITLVIKCNNEDDFVRKREAAESTIGSFF